MPYAQKLRLATRLLRRDARAGELNVIIIALLIAITSHTAIGHFTTRISRAMAHNANHILGGDLAIGSSRAFAPEIAAQAEQNALRIAETQRFSSVVSTADEFLLVSVKSVSANYPLKGQVKITDELYGVSRAVAHTPKRGEVWVEPRLLHQLKLQLGDQVKLGDRPLRIAKVLTYEPDRGNSFYSFTPRIMMNQLDLAATNIVQPGSRVWYRMMFAGPAASIAAFETWLNARLQPHEKIYNLQTDRRGVSETLDKANQYMRLASLMALLLAAVAIASSGRHYSERHYDTSALLRCLGCQQNDILTIYLLQLIILALGGGLLGNLLGWLAHIGLFALMANLLPQHIPPPTWDVAIAGLALSLIVLLGFTLPSIVRLKSVSPLRVLRNEMLPMPLSGWLVGGGSLLLVVGLMWFYTESLLLTFSIIGGGSLIFLVTVLLLRGLFAWLGRLLTWLPVAWRAGLRNFLRRRRDAIAQTLAFSLTIMAMLVIVLVRFELLSTWRASIPPEAPNHFVLNIQTADTTRFVDFMRAQDIPTNTLYPIVRGRLTHINDKPVRQRVSKEANDQANNQAQDDDQDGLNRELNLTWSATLPPDNTILDGQWWPSEQTAARVNAVSVEAELAERLNIRVGDNLTFFTGERQWQTQVANIRSVKWDNFNPNFYMVFNPGALQDLPVTWISTFYLPTAEKKRLVELIKQFPSITLLEIDAILNQAQAIISQVVFTLEAILAFVLAAGLSVTAAAIQTTLGERLREGAILRTLGAERQLLRRNQIVEFASIGLLSGLLGVIGAELTNAILYQRLFELTYTPTWWVWLFIPLAAALLITLIGTRASHRVLNQSPLTTLREV